MKVLESSKFKILSDRFIGVYFDKTKQIAKEGEENLNVNYWQIYDAKTCVVYPDKFTSLFGFEKGVGVVQGFDNMYKYIKIENGKCRYLGIKNERIKILGNFKKASPFVAFNKQHNIFIAVVLPAPLRPRRAKVSFL